MNKGRNYQIIFLILASLLCNAAEKMEFTTHITDSHYSPLLGHQLVSTRILQRLCSYLSFEEIVRLREVCTYFTQREFTANVVNPLIQEKYPATDDILGTHGLSAAATLLVYCSDPVIEWQFTRSNLCDTRSASYNVTNKLQIRNIALLMRTKMRANYDIYENYFKDLKQACDRKQIANHLPALLHKKYRENEIAKIELVEIPQERYNEFLILYSLLIDETCKVTALYRAVEAADLQKIAFLLQNGADCNAIYKDCTVPHKALYNKIIEQSTCLLCAIRAGNLDMIKLLIAHGADVNAFHKLTERSYRDRPIFGAISFSDYYAAAKLLLDNGLDPKLTERNGFNSLEYALLARSYKIAKLLIESGKIVSEDCNNRPESNKMELGEECCDFDMIKFLVEHKFNPNYFFNIGLNSITRSAEVAYPLAVDKDTMLHTIGYLLENNVQFADIQNIYDWAKITMGGNEKAIALAHKYGPKLS